MYASNVNHQGKERQLHFFVSGKLWGGSLVMEDKETGTEWSHILGRAMAGRLEGASLTIIPSMVTNWETWKLKYPATTATMIDPTAQDFETEMLDNAKRFGLGLVHRGQSRFWRFDRLLSDPLVNDEFAGLALVVYFDSSSRTPMAWKRELPTERRQKPISFQMTAKGVQDQETGSMWDLKLGKSIDGPLAGTRLVAVPAIVSFTSAWKRFHPDSSSWEP